MRKAGIIAVAVMLVGLGALFLWLYRDRLTAGGGEKPVAAAAPPSAPISSPNPPVSSPSTPIPPPAVAEQKPVAPSFDVVRINPQGGAVIAGKSEPGARVTIQDGDRTVGETTADERGDWVLVPEKPMPAGNRELSLTARSARDGSVARSDDTVALVVPESAKRAAEDTVAVLVPSQPEAPVRPLQVPSREPSPGPASPAIPVSAGSVSPAAKGRMILLDAVEYDHTGKILFSGRATPGARLTLYVEGFPVGGTQADGQGRWSVRPAKPFKVGHYRLRMDDMAADGKVLARSGLIFARDDVPEGGVEKGRQMIQPRNNLWRLARDTYGLGIRYTDIYSANRSEIEDPDLIYPGQIIGVPSGR